MTLYLINSELDSCIEFNGHPLVIDGANVAFENVLSEQKAKLLNLTLMEQYLELNGISDFLVLSDKSLRYKIDKQKKYCDLIKFDKRYFETPGGTQADHFILQNAYKCNGYIVSNDNYRDFYAIYEKDWIIEHRISFCIINNEIYLDKLICK